MEREQATKFIYDLLRALIAKKGSDLFITAGFPPAMKIDSKMTPVSQQALTAQHTAMLVRAMLSESIRAVISQTLLKTKDNAGRVAAHEIMIGTPAIRNLIRENKIAQMYSAIQTGRSIGMQTLDQNLQELVQRNIVSNAEARGKAANKDNFPG